MTVNIGPHHPATHGVLRLVVDLEGEVVKDLKPIIGYVHTGIEKSCEDKSYWKVIPFVERMDYVSYFFQMEAFCGAVERLIELEIPRAGQVPADDLPRAQPDPLPPGLAGDDGARPRRDLDALVLLPRARPHPRPLRDGDRAADAHALLPGRRRDRGHPASASRRSCASSSPRCRCGSSQYQALLDRNEVFLSRTKGTGIVSRERLLELGVTGPLLRAAGEPWDLRKAFDYLAYPEFDFKIPVGTVGDNYDRYRVRVAEMVESTRIIEQALDAPARGPLHRRRPQVRAAAALGALDLDGVADPPLQARHRGLPGRRRARSTTRSSRPRGELGCFVLADGSAKPARVHFRDPSFVNLQAFKDMAVDSYIADMICSLGMLDPILGGVDR